MDTGPLTKPTVIKRGIDKWDLHIPYPTMSPIDIGPETDLTDPRAPAWDRIEQCWLKTAPPKVEQPEKWTAIAYRRLPRLLTVTYGPANRLY